MIRFTTVPPPNYLSQVKGVITGTAILMGTESYSQVNHLCTVKGGLVRTTLTYLTGMVVSLPVSTCKHARPHQGTRKDQKLISPH